VMQSADHYDGGAPAFRIRRIRLVNFHNFQDETVEVSDGGHLFLLGDNGSGKTTVLDAVHYVLTAGNHMEFNSAARVGARRDGGRRPQGIVMRYNVDTGAMNPSGGVSYAGVELVEEDGSPLTLGVGLSTYSMDERIQRWGIIKSAPIDTIPWTVEHDGARRVTSQREMREALGPGGGFLSIGAYAGELGRRLFTSDEIFAETCRFLSMGKAYREIASSATDYHELFKTLLPEPQTDLFDRIIEALRGLDEANALLEEMQRKREYLDGLDGLVKTVGELRESTARYRWILLHFKREHLREHLGGLGKERERTDTGLERLAEQLGDVEDRLNIVQRTMEDLRSRDNAGLIRRRNELRDDRERAQRRLTNLSRELTSLSQAVTAADRNAADALSSLRNVVSVVHRMCEPIERETDVRTAEAAARLSKELQSDSPAVSEARSVREQLSGGLDHARVEAQRELDSSNDACRRAAAELGELRDRRAELERSGDVRPPVAGLAEALRCLADEGVEAHSLYELLEWRTELSDEARSSAEEAIDLQVLATVCVDPADYEEAKRIVTGSAACVRIAPLSLHTTDLPDWIRTSFEISRSQPGALTVLAEEMLANRGPSRTEEEAGGVLMFRAHERRLSGEPSRYIGQEERQKALERALEEMGRQIDECEQEHTRAVRRHDETRRRLGRIDRLIAGLRNAGRDLAEIGAAFALRRQELTHRREQHRELARRHGEAQTESEGLASRLEAIEHRVRAEGLEELESRLGELDGRRREYREEHDRLLREEGAAREHRDGLVRQASDIQQELCGLRDRFAESEAEIRRHAGEDIEDIEHYVLKTRQGGQFKSTEGVEGAIRDADRREAAAIGSLRVKLTDPVYSAAFGFHYDETTNRLVDRRESTVADLAEAQRKAIGEQEQVINERTAELFRKIIVTELVAFFGRHVSRLERMVRTINDRLSRRTFGNTRYRLELQREDRYKPLIEAVRQFNPFDSGTEEVLRHFIEDHRDEILSTEIETVPAALDYRNWYSYHLRMATTDEDGVLIDRRTRSVGSGGEQAVPNYLTILTVAHFLFRGNALKLHTLLFDEAFYGIDAGRRDQLLGFAGDMGLQLLVASPEQDGARREVERSTTVLIVKDSDYNVHLYPFHWENPAEKQLSMFEEDREPGGNVGFEKELGSTQ